MFRRGDSWEKRKIYATLRTGYDLECTNTFQKRNGLLGPGTGEFGQQLNTSFFGYESYSAVSAPSPSKA